MTQLNGNSNGFQTVAPLTNVALCNLAITTAMERKDHLPGMVCFYGPSGWGKSTAAARVALEHGAYYIELKDSWVKKSILHYLLQNMGIPQKKTNWEMTEQVCKQLAASGRPLIIDEMDKVINKKAVELVRDIYDGSGATILLIGEEQLPHKLSKWERFHGRILDWFPAQPADLRDTKHLKELYHPGLQIADNLLEKVTEVCGGSIRRICVNLAKIERVANETGAQVMDLKAWQGNEFYTGKPPAARMPHVS